MTTLIKHIDSLVTLKNGNPDHRAAPALMADLSEINDGAILFAENVIATGTTAEIEAKIASGELAADAVIEAKGKTLMPGFVDSHTHIVFGGDRSKEFGKRLRGATYKEIAQEGGGILCTVKGTREASKEQLLVRAKRLAWEAISHGTTAMEVKSGYGLTTESEIKMLEVIQMLKEELPIEIIPTFLGAHDFPPEYSNGQKEGYVDLICNEMLPIVAERHLAEYCDAFVDEGYYTIAQARKIFEKAKSLGIKTRIHADEMASVHATGFAAEIGSISADHLLFISDEDIEKAREAGMVCTSMPGTAYFIRMPYAPARKIIDKGAILALASDCNPGSCYTQNMQLVMSLAVINMKMTAEEAICAATINGAKAVGRSNRLGSLANGKQADFIILDSPSYIDMFYHFGVNHVSEVWTKGRRIKVNEK